MVEYFSNPDLPGRSFFQCSRLRATLASTSCADMWRKANGGEDEGARGNCKLCPIGAVHAGEVAASMSPLKNTLTCARCHRGATRLIGKHVCVSCYNRAREFVLGRNAKGTAPIHAQKLSPRRVRYLLGDEVRIVSRQLTADTDELIVALLRDSRKKVVFAWDTTPPAAVAQARLW